MHFNLVWAPSPRSGLGPLGRFGVWGEESRNWWAEPQVFAATQVEIVPKMRSHFEKALISFLVGKAGSTLVILER